MREDEQLILLDLIGAKAYDGKAAFDQFFPYRIPLHYYEEPDSELSHYLNCAVIYKVMHLLCEEQVEDAHQNILLEVLTPRHIKNSVQEQVRFFAAVHL
jgi:hypothetical protein